MGKAQTRIMYIERCTGEMHRGPAWIGRVSFSHTGRTIYYRDFVLRRAKAIFSNHIDTVTGDEFWVSGPKKNGEDRHWCGGGPVLVDEDAAEEYWTEIRGMDMPKDPYRID